MCSEPGQDLLRRRSPPSSAWTAWSWPPARPTCTRRRSGSAAQPRVSIPSWWRWPTSASTAPGCTSDRDRRPRPRRRRSDPHVGGAGAARTSRSADPRARSRKRALVIGGGIAGIQAALDIADGGYQVVLVEREPSIGGQMASSAETFPTLDCSQCILTPQDGRSGQPPRTSRSTPTPKLEAVDGYIGNFQVTIRKKARSVDMEKCTGCGVCMDEMSAEEDPQRIRRGMGVRQGDLCAFPQAVPTRPVIDRENCTLFTTASAASARRSAARRGAIIPRRTSRSSEDRWAPSSSPPASNSTASAKSRRAPTIKGYGEFGHGKIPDVIDGMPFERLASASGPTGGKILRPSDGKEPKHGGLRPVRRLARPGKRASPTAPRSAACTPPSTPCSTSTRCTTARRYVFYMDIRAPARGTTSSGGGPWRRNEAVYIRGMVSRMYEKDGKVVVLGSDISVGVQVEIEADLVVLATAVQPRHRRRATGPEAGDILRQVQLLLRGPRQAPAGGVRHRRGLPGRGLPGAEGHPGYRQPRPPPPRPR